MRIQRDPRTHRRLRRDLLFWGVVVAAALLLYHLVAALIKELPRVTKGFEVKN